MKLIFILTAAINSSFVDFIYLIVTVVFAEAGKQTCPRRILVAYSESYFKVYVSRRYQNISNTIKRNPRNILLSILTKVKSYS